MRHGHTSRGLGNSLKTIFAFVGLGVAASCSDSINAPTRTVSFKHPAQFTEVLDITSFRYDPAEGLHQRLGNHVLVIPAGGVCDPATSGYGPELWDADCEPLSHSIIITATTLSDDEGHPYVDFEPALRFVPTKETNLYLHDGPRTDAVLMAIDYCNADVVCVDEAANDSSLVTHRVGMSRFLVRRIKHFSGYTVAAGEPCSGTITDDPEGGLWCEEDGMSRSGYMVASGLTGTGGNNPRRKKYDK